MSFLHGSIGTTLRSLLRRPAFLLVSALTLAVGIGAGSAVFMVFNAVLLRPLPYPNVDQLAMIWSRQPGRDPSLVDSMPDFLDWQRQSRSFAEMTLFAPNVANLTGAGEPEELTSALVSPRFFHVLDAQPLLGRTLAEGDQDRPAVVLSYQLWHRRFAGDPAILGRKLLLGGKPYEVVGVLPMSFRQPEPFVAEPAELWLPLGPSPGRLERGTRYLRAIGRLRPGVSLAAAQQEMAVIARGLAVAYPRTNAHVTTLLVPLPEQLQGALRPKLILLLTLVGLILAITCVNVASLELARAAARGRESAIRTALGARRAALLRDALLQSLLLALTGGAAGLLIAAWGGRALSALVPPELLAVHPIRLDWRVVIFSFSVALVCCLLAGLVPALHLSRLKPAVVLKDANPPAGKSRYLRLDGALVIAEIAFSLPLLIVALLVVRSYVGLLHVRLGFSTENLLTFELSLPRDRYPGEAEDRVLYHRLLDEIARHPGVKGVGLTSGAMLTSVNDQIRRVAVDGGAEIPPTDRDAHYREVSEGYLTTMGVPTVAGRGFNRFDRAGSQSVALVNRGLARRLWPGLDPLGRRLRLDVSGTPWMTVVGVVADVRARGPQSDPVGELYVPFDQDPTSTVAVVVHTAEDPAVVAAWARQSVRLCDPDLPVSHLRSVEAFRGETLAQVRFNGYLLAAFAGIALVVAALGVFGMVSNLVRRRHFEIGIRMAMGARRGRVVGLVLAQGLALGGAGIAAGLLASLAGARLLSHLLTTVPANDAATSLAAAALVMLVVLVACLVPARAAAAIQPAVTLRQR